MIITGLKHQTATGVVKELNKAKGLKLKEEEIEYVVKLSAGGGKNERVKVVFYNRHSQDAV